MDTTTVLATDATAATVPSMGAVAVAAPKFRVNLAMGLIGLAFVLMGQEILEESVQKLFSPPVVNDVTEYDPRESPCYAGCPD